MNAGLSIKHHYFGIQDGPKRGRRGKLSIMKVLEQALPLALPAHKVEVAAFIGLQNRLVEQVRVAASGPFGRDSRHQRRAALRKLRFVDQQIDAAFRDIEADHVAVPDQRQRTAHGGFRRDVQHDGAERGAAHARIRNPHHVLDAAAGELPRNRSEEHTSELQSHVNLVCRLLLEKKKPPVSTTSKTPCPIAQPARLSSTPTSSPTTSTSPCPFTSPSTPLSFSRSHPSAVPAPMLL